MTEFVWKRRINYVCEHIYIVILKPLILLLMKTSITPNMVTIFNLCLVVPLVLVVGAQKNRFVLALLIFAYLSIDIIDGNLARNKNMCSALGKKLDTVSDTIFYIVGYFFIGYAIEAPIYLTIILVVTHQIYGLIATYYIVPSMKKNMQFKHTRIKVAFESRGLIFGMDASAQNTLTIVFLLTPIGGKGFVLLILLWIVDLIYRLYELLIYNNCKSGK